MLLMYQCFNPICRKSTYNTYTAVFTIGKKWCIWRLIHHLWPHWKAVTKAGFAYKHAFPDSIFRSPILLRKCIEKRSSFYMRTLLITLPFFAHWMIARCSMEINFLFCFSPRKVFFRKLYLHMSNFCIGILMTTLNLKSFHVSIVAIDYRYSLISH